MSLSQGVSKLLMENIYVCVFVFYCATVKMVRKRILRRLSYLEGGVVCKRVNNSRDLHVRIGS